MRFSDKIPESIRSQLSAYESTLFLAETTLALGASIAALAASLLVFFGVDRLFDTPALARTAIFAAGFLPAILLLVRWIKSWIVHRRDVRTLALEAQKKHGGLGDRLLSAVELAESDQTDIGISEELLDAAIKRIADSTKDIDFKKDVDFKRPILAVCATLALLAGTFTLVAVFPDAFKNALQRWIAPFRALPRYTFTVISSPSSEIIVPKNEPFSIKCVLYRNSRWIPQKASYSLPGAGSGEANISNCETTLKLQGLNEVSVLSIHAGDATVQVKVIPLPRPFPKSVTATITPPAYTKRPPISIPMEEGALSLTLNSQYKINLEINRPLDSATMRILPENPKHPPSKTITLSTRESRIALPKRTAAETVALRLNWTDLNGLSPKTPYDIHVEAESDTEPFVECPSLAPFSAMLKDEVLMVRIKAKDDFGLKYVDGLYKVVSIDGKKLPYPSEERSKLASGSPTTQALEGAFAFSPEAMSIPEKSLVLIHGASTDYFPGRKEILSAPRSIYVLSHEQHAELLKEQMQRLMSQLEDMVRRENSSLNKNKSIKKMSDKKLTKQKTTDKLSEQRDAERSERREARKMADKMAKLMKEALRNKKFPDKTIAEWAKMIDKLNDLSQQEMKDLVNSLSKASSTKTPKTRRSEVEKSVEKQQQLVKKLKDMLSKMDQSMKSLALENFVNRLKRVAKDERSIARTTATTAKNIIGLPPDQIPQKTKDIITAQQQLQKSLKEEGKSLHQEIDAFFARTRIEKYKTVSDDMQKTHMEKKLESLEKTLAENRSMATIANAKKLSDDFNKWAKMLSQMGNKKAAPGKGQGQSGKVDMQLLMSILRIIQKEQNLRTQTRSLDKNKPTKQDEYKNKANPLAQHQQNIQDQLAKAIKRAAKTCPQACQPLAAAGKAMADAKTLLSVPKTGVDTVSAETAAIEILAGAARNGGKGKGRGKGSGFGAMMALLKMMLGTGTGATPGGSMAGGKTNAPNMFFNGNKYNRSEGEREVSGTAGVSKGIPEEFKSAIEAYFKKIKTK